jgi:hypothetical protein
MATPKRLATRAAASKATKPRPTAAAVAGEWPDNVTADDVRAANKSARSVVGRKYPNLSQSDLDQCVDRAVPAAVHTINRATWRAESGFGTVVTRIALRMAGRIAARAHAPTAEVEPKPGAKGGPRRERQRVNKAQLAQLRRLSADERIEHEAHQLAGYAFSGNAEAVAINLGAMCAGLGLQVPGDFADLIAPALANVPEACGPGVPPPPEHAGKPDSGEEWLPWINIATGTGDGDDAQPNQGYRWHHDRLQTCRALVRAALDACGVNSVTLNAALNAQRAREARHTRAAVKEYKRVLAGGKVELPPPPEPEREGLSCAAERPEVCELCDLHGRPGGCGAVADWQRAAVPASEKKKRARARH